MTISFFFVCVCADMSSNTITQKQLYRPTLFPSFLPASDVRNEKGNEKERYFVI